MPDVQRRAPLFEGLLRYVQGQPVQFHVPGHKQGKSFDPELRDFLGPNTLSLDLTNITALDDLHQPRSLIKQAQELAALAFGAWRTWFSVQGTSTAIMAMIMTVCAPGEKLILPRNIHRAVLSALILSGAQPVFLAVPSDPVLGVAWGIAPDQVREALEQHPDAKGILLLNPTYYGFASNLREIVELAHGKGLPVLVDEAHGCHFHFHPDLPPSAMQCGADLAATSVHKLGGSLTQSSILNLQGPRVDPARLQVLLNTLTTTSASYLLLASLDAARRHLALNGKRLLNRALEQAVLAREQISRIAGLDCPGAELPGRSAHVHAFDPTKLIIPVRQLGITGRQAELWLSEECGVQVELGDLGNLLCVVTAADDQYSINRLLAALTAMADAFRPLRLPRGVPLPDSPLPQLVLNPRRAFYAQAETLPLEQAVGRVCAQWVLTYPPGIPLILPGELFDHPTCEQIRQCVRAGITVLGMNCGDGQGVRVVRDCTDG